MQIFSKKEMNSDNVMQIVTSLNSTGLKEEPEFTKNFLISMAKTTKFDLVLKMLTKSEKASNFFKLEIRNLI